MPRAALAPLASLALESLACFGPVIEVEGARPAFRDIERALTTNGRIEASGGAAARAALAGRVESVLARRGDRVARGQELLRLADSGQAESRVQAQARLDAAKARLAVLEAGPSPSRRTELLARRATVSAAMERASADLERLKRLAARNAAPRGELEAQERALEDDALEIESLDRQLAPTLAKERREELAAEVARAESELAQAEASCDALRVRSPVAGVAYSLAVSEGDYLQAGGLAARIGTLDAVRVRIFVDEPDLGRVAKGSRAILAADAYPGREWGCEVDRLATEIVATGARRVGELECGLANPDGLLLPNLAVGVRIVTDRAPEALSVPRHAVGRSGGQAYVWTVRDGAASRREIVTGVEGPAYIEVRSGLDSTETVLVPRDEPLREGRRVRAMLPGAGHGG